MLKSLKRSRIHNEVVASSYSLYTSEEIRHLAVAQITEPVALDNLDNAISGGVCDPRLGPVNNHTNCHTCSLSEAHCPGHCGYLELAAPVYQPLVFSTLTTLLQAKCFNCHKMILSDVHTDMLTIQLLALDCGLYAEALEIGDFESNARGSKEKEVQKQRTRKYQSVLQKIRKYMKIEDEDDKDDETKKSNKSKYNFPKTIPVMRPNSTLINGLRKQVVKDFWGQIRSTNKCNHCNYPRISIKTDAKSKIKVHGVGNLTQLKSVLPSKGKTMSDQSALAAAYGSNEEMEEKSDESEEEEKDEQEQKQPTDEGDQSKANTAWTKDMKKSSVLLNPIEARNHIRLLWENNEYLLNLIFGALNKTSSGITRKAHPEMFFMDTIVVTPNRFRPAARGATGLSFHDHTNYYIKIIQMSRTLLTLLVEKNTTIYAHPWIELQKLVNYLIDNKTAPPTANAANGITQILEKKEGLFRRNMMGKRVNFAARTVISPDPFLETNQIGIPLYFAERLHFPEPVTERNYKEMAQAVINGPFKYPGAVAIENEMGNVLMLHRLSEDKRIAESKLLRTFSDGSAPGAIKKVYRHIRDGDIVLLNRQPTLHKASIMANFVKVLKVEKTLRMHYANCATFNADFDGDEMNIHFPQNPIARAEAMEIAMADHQYITVRNGGPLRGLIQDHVVTGVLLTKRDTFLTREQFQQIVYSACLETNADHPFVTPVPAVLKPGPLWTGKQVISTILKHLTVGRSGVNMESKAKVPEDMWGKSSGEGDVIVRDNELLTGVLDKNTFGASQYGLVHACYELYGAIVAGKLLSCLSRLFTIYLQQVGFSCGMDDLLLMPAVDENRSRLLKESNLIGHEVAANYAGKDKHNQSEVRSALGALLKDDSSRATLDNLMKAKTMPFTSKIIDSCLPNGQLKKFPANYLSMMTVSGAKGSAVNFSQISCLLGQQELEGRRVPVMPSGKTLPSFEAFDTSSRAGGYIMDRFLTGIKPQEYYFHCMAGREGLVDTAVKTSRSGYLQRCLIKHMEGLRVHYDHTVRNSDGSVVQFYYGEDGLDVSKTAYLEKFKFLSANYNALKERHWPQKTLAEEEGRSTVQPLDIKLASDYYKKLRKQRKKTPGEVMDPINSQLNPNYFIGATSERYLDNLNAYIKSNPDGILKDASHPNGYNKSHFKATALMKFHHSFAQPGEAVGLLAAQSIGEPSTQMTLNTFHLAGRGDVNVTLGIPRLREILMTASAEISTPLMTLPLLDQSLKSAEALKIQLSKIKMSTLLEEIVVKESASLSSREYSVNIIFKPHSDIYGTVTMKKLSQKLERNFLKDVDREIKKFLSGKLKVSVSKRGKNADGDAEEDNEDEEGETGDPRSNKSSSNDDDGSISKAKDKKKEKSSYDDEEEVKEEKKKKKKSKKSQEEDEENSEEDSEEDSKEKDKKKKQDKKVDNMIESESEEESEEEEEEKEEEDSEENSSNVMELAASNLTFIRSFSFDTKARTFQFKATVPSSNKKILMLNLVDTVAARFVVQSTQGINNSVLLTTTEGGKTNYAVQTEGVDIHAVWALRDMFDVNRLVSNDIHAIRRAYGIEAARQTIVNEIASVFNVYGISVDRRHLSLIADYMTFEGNFKAMSRLSIASNPSPYQKMSFESTVTFITNSIVSGELDLNHSPSSKIVLGSVVEGGTGGFECFQRVK